MRGPAGTRVSHPSGVTRTISPGPTKRSISKPRFGKAQVSELTAKAPSRRPIASGVRPRRSRAA